jgi:protein SCO1/2
VTSPQVCDVRSGRRAALAVVTGTVLAGGLLVGCADPAAEGPVSNVTVHDEDGMNGAVPTEPYVVPPVSLTATDGSDLTLAEDLDRPLTLVFFGYTQCPDICQVVMADIANTLNRLEAAEREQVGMVFVTTDPARDDEVTLRTYLDRFDPSFEGLTGPLPDVVELGKAVGVAVEKGRRLPSGGYEVDHGTHVLGMTPDGTVPILWTQGTAPEQVAEDIRVVLAEGGVPPGGNS